jgi:anti-sigma-K factor RskA
LHRKGTEPVTPRFHEEFVALCALFYSGEISDEEWALLQVHMAYCGSCRETFEQYQLIHADVIPAMAAAAAEQLASAPPQSAAAFADAESRLMSRVGNSEFTLQQKPNAKKPSWRVVGGALAASAIVFAAFAYSRFERSREVPERVSASPSPPNIPSAVTPSATSNSDALALQESHEETTRLQSKISALESQTAQSDSVQASLKLQLQTEQAQREQLASQQDALNAQLATAHTDIQALRDHVSSEASSADKQTAAMVALQAKVRSLDEALGDTNSALEDRERMLALDKDFLAHDRDIRDLIGARDLYIADIFDTTESGKTAKPFGRIFYTRDRSLVFYGFDLEKQSGLKQDVAFQVWGSGSESKPVNLGLFYQDDSHKRWVLRFNDAKTLAQLNMVFVTVEPPGGSTKPTGKQLLRAYLQIQPNHP